MDDTWDDLPVKKYIRVKQSSSRHLLADTQCQNHSGGASPEAEGRRDLGPGGGVAPHPKGAKRPVGARRVREAARGTVGGGGAQAPAGLPRARAKTAPSRRLGPRTASTLQLRWLFRVGKRAGARPAWRLGTRVGGAERAGRGEDGPGRGRESGRGARSLSTGLQLRSRPRCNGKRVRTVRGFRGIV